jgi:transposase
MGFLTMLTAEGHLSKRKICTISEHLGIKISLGALCNIYKLATDLLQEPHEIIRDHVLNTQKLNADETSWRILSKKCWVWIGATANATFFKIDPSRSTQAYQRIFGGFNGTLTTDRYGAYNKHTGRKQSCLAHIDRYFVKMSQRPGIDGSFGKILEQQLNQIFILWREFREGKFSREDLQKKVVDPIENIKVTLMYASQTAKDRKSRALAHDLLDRFETLWTFIYEEGIEPTNNLAERGLRAVVIFRKLSYGSQSVWGAEFIERVMTVACTLKQNAGNLFKFLTELFEAHQKVRDPPALAL